MNKNYKFITNSTQNEYLYNPENKVFKFYQLCTFKNPSRNKYHIRRIVMNSKNEFISIDEDYIDTNKYNKFIQTHKLNEYKKYNTYDLDYIGYPTLGEIAIIQSPMLQQDSYGDYAKF